VVDIGIETCAAYRDVLVRSASVLWNGLLGEASDDDTNSGTYRVVQACVEASPYTLAVGDESIAIADYFGMTERFLHVARGGDASLSLLQGSLFPGIESLRS
jgi:phosphoglycerate kinase